MFDIVKLRLEHLEAIISEPENRHLQPWLDSGYAKELADAGGTASGFVNGELMVSGGFTPYWKGRAHLWCIFSEKSKDNFVAVFRGLRVFISSSPYRRLELDVPLDNEFSDMAQKRAELWGFKLECSRAKFYRPNGGDAALYSWTKES